MADKLVGSLTKGHPSGTILGRLSNGDGPTEYLSVSDLAQTIASTGVISGSGGASLGNSGVTAGSYTSTNLTVNAQGIITAASNGSGGGGSGLFNQVLSATPTAASTGLSTWLNQGTATVSDGTTGIVLTTTAHAGLSVRMRTMAAPATPYTITALIGYMTAGASNAWSGIGWYDGTNKLELIGANFSSSWLFLAGRMSTPTSFSANDAASAGNILNAGLFWVQIHDDGTTVSFKYGIDGANFLTLYSVAKASGYLGSSGYSNLGFFVTDGSNDAISTLLSWTKS